MRIYFTASLTGKKIYLENYKKIVALLEKLGHKVICEHMFLKNREEIEKETWADREKYQKDFHKWLSVSDLVVAEISYPSTGVGYQITQAMEKGKPVLALHLEEKVPVALLGEPSEKLILASYSLSTLEKDLISYLEEAVSQMDVRFNFFISPKIGAYMDWISRQKKTPRAVYLRKLIEEDMTKSGYVEKRNNKNKNKKKTE